MSEYVSCPWCKEDDFDLQGLKFHLEHGHCEEYEKCDTPKSAFELALERAQAEQSPERE
jgi:hypothetical protein